MKRVVSKKGTFGKPNFLKQYSIYKIKPYLPDLFTTKLHTTSRSQQSADYNVKSII